MPERIQRTRKKGSSTPEGTIYVGRPGPYGNPFKVGELNPDTGETVSAEKCLEYFEFFLTRKYEGTELREFLAPLRGKNLSCWCRLDRPCHADVLIRLANHNAE